MTGQSGPIKRLWDEARCRSDLVGIGVLVTFVALALIFRNVTL